MSQETKKHHWNFQRIGGLDQVVLLSDADIRSLGDLDPKLWVALSCPTAGLEFDERTLSLLDADGDGHIRIPEVIEAVKWTCGRLADFTSFMADDESLPLSAIDTDNDDGKKLFATAQAILKEYGKSDSGYMTLADVTQARLQVSKAVFNGDGVFPPLASQDEGMQLFIQDALSVMGGVVDVSGETGINHDIAHAFVKTLQDWVNWRKGLGAATSVFGDNTPQAWDLMVALKNKIDDYFLRSDLASYAPQAQISLNVDEKFLVPAQNGVLEDAALATLPLSKIAPAQPLDLVSGLNPVWRESVEQFAGLIAPLLAHPGLMTRPEWLAIQKALEPYAQVIASKPALVSVSVTVAPALAIDKLSEDRINANLQNDVLERFDAMVQKDAQTPVAATDIAALERLVYYHKYLYRLLLNFVSFNDFFDLNRSSAVFQAGHLYIDGLCCYLCVPVTNVEQHSGLSGYSELFLLYCECTRKMATQSETQKITIAAAVTAGHANWLVEGRNGVFIDNHGNDWDARVVKVVVKPVSLRQAVWAPYKRVGKLIGDQVNKWGASKEAAVTEASVTKIQTAGDAVAAPAAPAAAADASSKFDIGKSVGIFAAIGLALGALGTALASITRSLFDLQWWQFPLVFLAIFLIISGPSVLLAWLKLRQRTLGPLLEASGWAINGSVKINYALGAQLTNLAQLPPNATRNLTDPLQDKKKTGLWVFLIALLVGALAVGGWLWYKKDLSASVSALAPLSTPVVEAVPAPQTAAPQESTQEPAQQAPAAPVVSAPATPVEGAVPVAPVVSADSN